MAGSIRRIQREYRYNVVKSIFRKNLATQFGTSMAFIMGPVVDGIVTGNYLGVNAVAANSLLRPAFLLFTITGSVLAGGSRSLYTEHLGRGETDKANSAFSFALILSAAVALVFAACCLLIPSLIMRILGANTINSYLEPLGAAYLRGYAFGLPFVCCATIMSGYMSLDNDFARPIFAVGAMTGINVILDFVVVLCTDLGMYGLALATSASYVGYFLVLATHFFRKDRNLRFHVDWKSRPFSFSGKMFYRGSISAMNKVAASAAGILINHILTAQFFGPVIAVYGMQNSVLYLFGFLYLGTSDSVWVMSGIFYSEEDRYSLNDLQIASMGLGIPLSVICGAVLFLFPRFFAGLYLGFDNAATLAMGAEGVRVVAFALPLRVFLYCLINYLQGVRKIETANTMMLLMILVVPVGLMKPCIAIFGQQGVWFSIVIVDLILSILALAFILLQKGKTLKDKRLFVGDRIASGDREMEFVIDTMMEVSAVAGIAMLFCRENGYSDLAGNRIALFTEEMTRNIIQHGFDEKKQNLIYIRLLARDDGIILRIRDDCRPFNPVERYKLETENNSDPTANMGIRLVMGLASDVQYISTFKTNTLIVRVDEKALKQEG